MTPANKLRMALIQLNTTQVELARRTNQTQANLSAKICADRFTIKEFEKLVKALGCELEMNIILPDGERV